MLTRPILDAVTAFGIGGLAVLRAEVVVWLRVTPAVVVGVERLGRSS